MTNHKAILIIYAILGLPGLFPACIFWLSNRYIFGNRHQTKEDFLSFMMACTVFMALVFGVMYLVK
jgi:TRAP-type C4-dicarboxylate transport system permease small subunit